MEQLELKEECVKVQTGKVKGGKGYRLTAKNLFLTYPQCELERHSLMNFLKQLRTDMVYCLIAKENHKDGTPHLHALITTKDKVDTRDCRHFDLYGFHGNYQAARDTDKVREYLLKSDSEPLEIGTYLSNKQSAIQERAKRNKVLLELPLPQLVNEGVIALQQYKVMHECRRMYTMDKLKADENKFIQRTCIWIHGPPRSGKSYASRTRYGDQVYEKPQNKWWDGYLGEPVVLLDDFDKNGACLSHLLKIWSDNYMFNGEVKGTYCRPSYTKFIITSNYRPEDIWPTTQYEDNEVLCRAIRGRFTLYVMRPGHIMEEDTYIPSYMQNDERPVDGRNIV